MSSVKRVLLVEDNPGDVCILRIALKQAAVDCELTVLKDGEEALTYVRRAAKYADAECPDLAILDMTLPKHDAAEILTAMRSSEKMSHVRAVIMTSLASPQELTRVRKLGIEAEIVKPGNLDDFLQVGVLLKSILFQQPKALRAHGD